ncbi:MAG: protein-disulfide reductase DsbD [Coxiellaceae bacterium]|nr:protein-disulfide reductase DsbD [Coxiellaceae bacterium]
MKQKFLLLLFGLLASTSALAATPALVNPNHISLTLLAFFGAGILLAFTPCVLPMIPILSGIIVGQKKPSTFRTLQLSVVFVLSMAVTYAVAGVIAGYLGGTIQAALQVPWVIALFSAIFVVMALSMFGWFEFRLPSFIQNKIHHSSNKQTSGSLIGVAAMGVLSTLIASPCVTAPLVTVLTYIGETGNALLGGGILFSLALGMGVPLILFGLGEGVMLPRAGQWMYQVKALFGVMMLGVALWMLSRIIPMSVTMLLAAVLIIVSAVAFGALDFKGNIHRIQRGISFSALVYGVILMVGVAQGDQSFWPPLAAHQAHIASPMAAVKPTEQLFTYVKTQAGLNRALASAKAAGKPAIVDFWADWCSDCAALDRGVLSNVTIQQQMQDFALIRVDVSKSNPELKAIEKAHKVYGIPAFVFYNKQGDELKQQQMSGEITQLSLSTTLKQLS